MAGESANPWPRITVALGLASITFGTASFGSWFTWLFFPYLVFTALTFLSCAVGLCRGNVQGRACVWWSISLTGLFFVAAEGLTPIVWNALELQARQTAQHNLTRLALAMHDHHDSYKSLPGPYLCDQDGTPLLSWRVKLLPHLGHEELYRQFQLDQPWDSPHNIRLLPQMPAAYRAPHRSDSDAKPYSTYFQVFTGPDTTFGPSRSGSPFGPPFEARARFKILGIPNGASNVIMIAEAARAVSWTKPDDLAYATDQPLPALGAVANQYTAFRLVTHRRRGMHVAMLDGAVRWVDAVDAISEETLRCFIDPCRYARGQGDW